ncbi:Sodium-dependent nutrient amino acid transporter 1 [Babesia sp. Xinjiang]|uniref:Sodium-dependent nutrient amino acid transporter 1 n=1 Tax=Babesia sp. Xinjiang TaxID=462227 RepID=UPI000A2489CC|nr:Sodium-dependent nutrient amino acid transporter 1 [Babesia sp. Xinjiang]ORM41362.1 Sodium-dependent nutrient amino acid transporter 1 [Babesia sp. Xinjiang]
MASHRQHEWSSGSNIMELGTSSKIGGTLGTKDPQEPCSLSSSISETRSATTDEIRIIPNLLPDVRFARPFAAEMRYMPNSASDGRNTALGGFYVHNRGVITQVGARTRMLSEALQYTHFNGYRQMNHLRGEMLANHDRHFERETIQRDANLALQREDCREANFVDYVYYEPEEYNDAASSGAPTSRSSGQTRIDIPPASQRIRSMASTRRGIVEELVSQGVSPSEVAKLADIFEHPSCLRQVDMSLIPWIKNQSEIGYWRNEAALFVLCITMAICVGNVETMFKLNTTWDGMTFLLPYFLSYILVVQPMICLELLMGQLFRTGQSAMYDKLRRGSSGLGTAIVVICLVTGCVACARCAAEYLIYIVDIFKDDMPWKLTQDERSTCAGLSIQELCLKSGPVCLYNKENCVANPIGKAFHAYRAKFYPIDETLPDLEPYVCWAMLATYGIVTLFQLAGMGNFTFTASMVIIVAFFVSHVQTVATMSLEGGVDFLWQSIYSWRWATLYESSRLWSHSIRSCMYEFIVGSGVYSTLANKSRIGYDISKETVGVGLFSGYVTMLMFGAACGLVGHHAKLMNVDPREIIWMLEQDSSFILIPLGFHSTRNMERTLGVLQFAACLILLCATLAIQIEVAVDNLKALPSIRNRRIRTRWVKLSVIVFLFFASLFFATRSGKKIVWFLETALGDLGRSFTVLITSIVVGWFHGCDKQKDAIGTATVYTFNTVFWFFNILAFLCETCDESILAVMWWIARVLGICVATLVAVKVNQMSRNKRRPFKDLLWWLFCGNVEQLRLEMSRISPISKVGGVPMLMFWSLCIKWFIPCMISNTIADIIEEIFAPHRVRVNITRIPPGWHWITVFVWIILIFLVFTPPLILLFVPRLMPTYKTIGLEELPSAPPKYSIMHCLAPRRLFEEFRQRKRI